MFTLYFDMDGTIANLYEVDQWLKSLEAHDPTPYIKAKPMLDLRTLARRLNRLQANGFKLGIISWLAKNSTPNYDELVRIRKRKWLQKHLGSVIWDEMHLVKYGTPKHLVAKDKAGLIFDDNEEVRIKWGTNAYNEKEIMDKLKELL